MEYTLGLVALLLIFGFLYFFRKDTERRRELYSRSVDTPPGGNAVSGFVCVRLTEGGHGGGFRPPKE